MKKISFTGRILPLAGLLAGAALSAFAESPKSNPTSEDPFLFAGSYTRAAAASQSSEAISVSTDPRMETYEIAFGTAFDSHPAGLILIIR